MLVAVKKPRINVRVTGIGAREVVKALRKLYDVEVSHDDETVDFTTTKWWNRMKTAAHPGTVLWTYRDNAGISLDRLAELSGIAKPHLSAMENGNRAIGPRTAKKLAAALEVDYRLFL